MRSVSQSELLVAVDPRFRIAADLYNRGLTPGLASEDGESVDLSPRALELPFGDLVIESDEREFIWGGYRMVDFVPVAELEVRGLRNRYRTPGIGAPLAASLEPMRRGWLAWLLVPVLAFGSRQMLPRWATTSGLWSEANGLHSSLRSRSCTAIASATSPVIEIR